MEKYEPTQKEIDRAGNTMKELGLEERSQVEQDAFEAGQDNERESVLDKIRKYDKATRHTEKFRELMESLEVFIKNEVDIDKYFEEIENIAINYHLSFYAKRALREDILYIPERGELFLIRGVTPKTLIELLEKLPQISKYGVLCRPGCLSEDIIKKIHERFPEAEEIESE